MHAPYTICIYDICLWFVFIACVLTGSSCAQALQDLEDPALSSLRTALSQRRRTTERRAELERRLKAQLAEAEANAAQEAYYYDEVITSFK